MRYKHKATGYGVGSHMPVAFASANGVRLFCLVHTNIHRASVPFKHFTARSVRSKPGPGKSFQHLLSGLMRKSGNNQEPGTVF